MKYEWKKQDKELYAAKKPSALITVPEQNYLNNAGRVETSKLKTILRYSVR